MTWHVVKRQKGFKGVKSQYKNSINIRSQNNGSKSLDSNVIVLKV